MKKTLYSLMLSDDVVREIDRLAHVQGTNRSNLINHILADYVSVVTPEQRINRIFKAVEELLSPSRELVPFVSPNVPTMSLKSSLEYKYRPTIKYEVSLFGPESKDLGELSVVFRTQSPALIEAMTAFFRLLKQTEDALSPHRHEDALYDGRFVRSIRCPENVTDAEEIASAISDYVTLFDKLMKGYICGGLTAQQVAEQYAAVYKHRKLWI